MDPQLDELQRQRALVQQHLDWLDAQIAARRTQAPAAQPLVEAAPVSDAAASLGAVADPALQAAVADYEASAARSPTQLKQGCWLLFAAVLAFGAGAAVFAWYWLRRA